MFRAMNEPSSKVEIALKPIVYDLSEGGVFGSDFTPPAGGYNRVLTAVGLVI